VLTRRLVIDVPISTCVGCGTQAEGEFTYATGNGGISAPTVNLNPPAGWVALEPQSRLPEGKFPRTFAICASCYEKGPRYGDVPTRATFEAAPA
jgi:hypothetical protein